MQCSFVLLLMEQVDVWTFPILLCIVFVFVPMFTISVFVLSVSVMKSVAIKHYARLWLVTAVLYVGLSVHGIFVGGSNLLTVTFGQICMMKDWVLTAAIATNTRLGAEWSVVANSRFCTTKQN